MVMFCLLQGTAAIAFFVPRAALTPYYACGRGNTELFKEARILMKNRMLSLLLVMGLLLSLLPGSILGAETTAEAPYELRTLTFEDADYKGDVNYAGKKDWSSLIDSPQYGGPLLYPQDATTVYNWYDKDNTELKHSFTDEWGDHQYWGGGEAISHYVSGDYTTYGGYDSQLTVYKANVSGLATTGGGHNGSNNFAVHYGYVDNSGYGGTKLQCLTFGDNVARVIDHMYVNNITYAINCYCNGNGLTAKIGEDDWVKLVATGHHADGSTATAEIYMCKGPEQIISDWTKWDLSGLGAVTKLELNVMGSSDNGYGFSQPAYFAYDDVAVRFPLPQATCLRVLEDAPAAGSISAGGLYSLPLHSVFADSEGHSLRYSFETDISNEHTKIADGIFYFSTSEEGVHEVTLRAACTDGEVTHKLTITVQKASEGIEAQYGYDETPQSSVTVYVTLSNNGLPLLAADGETTLSHLEVTVPYFDLGLYGLESFYRYGTNGGKGPYTNETLILRPTGLHLYLYLLERYYMGLPEEQCCKGTSGVLDYARATDLFYMNGDAAYSSNGLSALSISGSATSLYMTNFWGHDENLMYYRNHCYPYMSAGWGATSDYILLSDGDTWDVAMFTNWNFYHSGYFASFTQDSYTALPGSELTVATQKWGTTAEATAFEPASGLSVALYDSDWTLVETLSYTAEGENTIRFKAPEKAGTYYLMAIDPSATDAELAKIAPATAQLLVHECTDSDGDKKCDTCGALVNRVPTLLEGVTDRTVTIQTGQSYQLHDLTQGRIFTDADDTLSYQNYFYRKSSDGGETWGELTGFRVLEHGGINDSVVNNTEGTYIYEFVAFDGYAYSEQTWTLTLITKDVVSANVSFYIGRDQNYSQHNTYPVLELYRTAGIDEELFDYVGWFTNAEGQTEYVYNPHAYTIVDGQTDYVVIDGQQYELFGYEKLTFTDSAFGAQEEGATPSGTVVSNYNMFYATVETGRYSTRAYGWNSTTEQYDIYLGGQSLPLPMETDIYGGGGNNLYLRVVSAYTTSKKLDGNYFSADDYYVQMIMPVTGSMIHAGDPYVSGKYTYYPFLSFAAGNGSLYNVYAYPRDTEHYIFNQTINNTTPAGYQLVTKSIAISTAIALDVTVPEDAEFGLYFQHNNFNTKEVEPTGAPVFNDDGTKTISYKVSKSNSNYTWRLSDPSGAHLTKAGWLSGLSSATQKTFTYTEATDRCTHDFSQLGTTVALRDEADIQVFLDHDGFMSTTETFRVRAFRMWQLINSDTANIMLEPNFNIQVLQGNAADIQTVNGGNAVNNWIDVTPSTTDIVAVNYDAIDVYSNADNHGTHGGLFPATAPERTGVFVITNEPAGTATATVSFNGGTGTDRGAEWDYNYDTWYYLDTDTAPTLDFTVTAADDVVVSYAVVTTDASLKSTLSGWSTLTADEAAAYHADLLPFRQAGTLGGTVIVRMTDSTGTSYCLVRVAQMQVTLENASHPGERIMPGDQVTMHFDGLYRSVNKVSGIFNPLTYYLRYTTNGTEVNGSLGQYQQMDRASITLSIPADLEFPEGTERIEYRFTNGYIYGSMYSASSPFDTLYNMTDTGVGTNFSAVGVSFVLSRLADIPFTVSEKVYYDVQLRVTDGENVLEGYSLTLTDDAGTALSADENGRYQLGFGTYHYTISKAGYICRRDSFTLGGADAENVVDGVLTLTLTMSAAAPNAWDGSSVAEPAQDESGVYQIATGAELAWFAQRVNSGSTTISAVLTADIDLASYAWTPIGSSEQKFAGSFDGQGHSIANLYADYAGTSTASAYTGLFGYVAGSAESSASVKNFSVSGSVSATSTKSVASAYVAGVVGRADYAQLSGITSNVSVSIRRVSGNWQYVAGIVGYATASEITDCANNGSVHGYQFVAGVVGHAKNSRIVNCINTGAITSASSYVAGVAARSKSSTLHGCVNTGSVYSSTTYAAGVAYNVVDGSISCCYNVGTVTAASNYAGGIVATLEKTAAMRNCYNAGTVTATKFGAAVVSRALGNSTTAEVYYLDSSAADAFATASAGQTAEAVTAETLASRDFVIRMNTGLDEAAFAVGTDYPVLRWQNPDAEAPMPSITALSLPESISVYSGKPATLTVTATPAELPLPALVWSSSNDAVATVDENGVVTVHATGTVTITVTAADNSALTASCTVTAIRYGDLNGDGRANTVDIRAIMQFMRGNALDDSARLAADVNNDGKVNTADISLIMQFMNGKISKFPAEE